MQHQHAPRGTGEYGHSMEGMADQEPVGQELQAGGPQVQVGDGQSGGQQPTSSGLQASPPPQPGGQVGQSQPGARSTQGVAGQGSADQAMLGHEQADGALDDVLSGSVRIALQDAIESVRACEWCADQCIDEGPEMARCIRLCRDVADLGRLNAAFVTRDSVFGPEVARTFAEAAQECAMECRQHSHEHCQACARVLRRAARTTRELLASLGEQGTGQEFAGQLPPGQ